MSRYTVNEITFGICMSVCKRFLTRSVAKATGRDNVQV